MARSKDRRMSLGFQPRNHCGAELAQ